MDSPKNPSISNPNPTLSPSIAPNCFYFATTNDAASSPFKGSHHHRVHCEGVSGIANDNCDGEGDGFACVEEEIEIYDEDLFAKYIDVDMIGRVGGGGEGEEMVEVGNGGSGREEEKGKNEENVRGNVQHCGRDCSKKVMPADELAELWITDPKRAKRILANRQSAARSKERKARYIAALERRLVAIEKEARTLARRLSVYQRDARNLTAENTELRLRLEKMGRQAQLSDDLNEALKREVDRLRLATGEIRSARAISFKYLGKHHTQFSSTLPEAATPHDIQLLPLFHTSASTTPNRPLSANVQSNALDCLQGLDIRNKGCLLQVENPLRSASASHNSSSQGLNNVFCSREYLVRVASPSISDSGSDNSAATY